MKTIYKYELISGSLTIEMPKGAEILCLQKQNGAPHIWALVSPNNPPEIRHFELYGTGHPMNEETNRRYIGTFLIKDDTMVFHLFEKTN